MILHIGRIILIVIEVVVLFNLLIVVHELGHFLAARWRGLYIEKFGVWFGKPLWRKTIKGVQYSLGSLPFGGFVALPQLAPMDIIEGKADVDRHPPRLFFWQPVGVDPRQRLNERCLAVIDMPCRSDEFSHNTLSSLARSG